MREPERQRPYWFLLLTVALGGVLAPLNSTMLAVALPELRADFDIGHSAISWLISAYLIAMAVAQPLGGRIGDQLGRARVFRYGLIAFLALSVGASLSPNFATLVALRTGQALVGAAVIPNGMAMLRTSVPGDRLGRSMGLTAASMSFAAAVGPLIGTALLAIGSWRLLFLMNVPLVLAALACMSALRYPEPLAKQRLALDWRGALAFAGALIALTFALNSLSGQGGLAAFGAGLGGTIVLAGAFYLSQRTSPMPMVEWTLFRTLSYAGATAYVALSNLVMYTTLVSIPFFIEEVQGKGSGTSGTLLGAMSVLIAVMSPIGGRLSDSLGRRLPALRAGSLFVLVAVLALLFGIQRDVSYAYLLVALCVLGLGMGLSFGPASTAAVESVSADLAGTAAGTNSMMRYIGSIVGVGILGAVLGGDGGANDVDLFRAIFAVLTGMAAAACLSTLFIHHHLPASEAARVTQDAGAGRALDSVP
ncbi:MAG: MFS transporter [Dehalococcoidia bacterium]